jgi:hypothetical protein
MMTGPPEDKAIHFKETEVSPKAAMPTGNDLRKLCMASGLIDSPMTVTRRL